MFFLSLGAMALIVRKLDQEWFNYIYKVADFHDLLEYTFLAIFISAVSLELEKNFKYFLNDWHIILS